MRTLPSGARPGHFVEEYVAAMSERFSTIGHRTPKASMSIPTSSSRKATETVAEELASILLRASAIVGVDVTHERLGCPALGRDDHGVCIEGLPSSSVTFQPIAVSRSGP